MSDEQQEQRQDDQKQQQGEAQDDGAQAIDGGAQEPQYEATTAGDWSAYVDAAALGEVGGYVGWFVGFGMLIAVMAWAVGSVVTYVIDVVRGGYE